MGWQIYDAKASFSKFSSEWDQLNHTLCQGHPLFDSRFISTLLEHFSTGSEKLCLFHNGLRITGATIIVAKGKGCWSSFRPAVLQTTPLLLEDPHLVDSLWSSLPGWVWRIDFLAVDPGYSANFDNPSLPIIRRSASKKVHSLWEKAYAACLAASNTLRESNIDHQFHCSEDDPVSCTINKLNTTKDIDEALIRYERLEGVVQQGDADVANVGNNPTGVCLREILLSFAASRQASAYEFHLGTHLLASCLTIHNDQQLICLKIAFDRKMCNGATEQLSLFKMIEKQFSCREREIYGLTTSSTENQNKRVVFTQQTQNMQYFRNRYCLYTYLFVRSRRHRLHCRPPEDFQTDPAQHEYKVQSCQSITAVAALPHVQQEIFGNDGLETSVDWFDLMETAVFSNDDLHYYHVSEEQIPRLILPIRYRTNRIVRKIESLSNYYTSLFTPLTSNNNYLILLEQIISAIRNDYGQSNLMRFSPMNPEAPAFKALLNALHANGWIPFTYFCFGNWFLKVDGNWESYLKSRSANQRSSIRRRCKRFSSEGGDLEIVTTPDNIEHAIAEFNEVYSASWKQPEPYPDFVPSLIRCLANNGTLRLGLARLHNRVVAAQLWYVWGDKAYIYKVAYHEEFSAFSPGTVLTAHLLRHVIDVDHVSEVDFLIGDDAYKRGWMSHRRERYGIVAYNPGSIVGLALLAFEIAGRVWKRLRQRYLPAKLPMTSKEE